jgi:magnesium chelatase family protein
VLFLDELSEFPRPSLEALRQPLEDGRVAVVRGQLTRVFPTRFLLLAATNPCPCGFAGDPRRCACSEPELARHAKRLSGPLLDRLDMLVGVQRPTAEELAGPPATSSAEARARVIAAREVQGRRLAGTGATCNADMDAATARRLAGLTPQAEADLLESYRAGALSTRGHQRVVRVARTVADLRGSRRVAPEDVMLAVSLRQHDRRREAAA